LTDPGEVALPLFPGPGIFSGGRRISASIPMVLYGEEAVEVRSDVEKYVGQGGRHQE